MSDKQTSKPDAAVLGVTTLFKLSGWDNDIWSKFDNLEELQKDLETSILADPIIHRFVYKHRKWRTESFTIQDPQMRSHLGEALAKYQDLDLDLQNWTFTPPYKPIVHRWDRLLTLCEDTSDISADDTAAHHLIAFLRPILATSIAAVARTKVTGKISFQDVWQILPPGELVMTTLSGVEAVCRVTKYKLITPERGPPYWVIHLNYLDWNGERCGYTTTQVHINHFELERVVSLPVYPLSFNPLAAQIKERTIQRGRKFESFRGYHFQTCIGTKILLRPSGHDERPIAGRVIIDSYAYYLANNIIKPHLLSLEEEGQIDREGRTSDRDWTPSSRKSSASPRSRSVSSVRSSKSYDSYQRYGQYRQVRKSLKEAQSRCEVLDTLTDEQCLLATPWVRGLDLKTKEWAQFCVDDMAPVVWNDEAFKHLILPGNEKELAWAFVENKALAANNFDDFVQDKGRGIIILMFGPPGVGKTYTAEAVAERARVPLYSVSAANLGTGPKEVEAALSHALELCKLWNAMLLLDEADVFLDARTNVDLARNELVAVFLTKLEYYQGICFMTTNRTSNLDHAVQSRVDLFLPYVDLTVAARRLVWDNFISKTGRDKFSISETELNDLADLSLNGREIKNLVKTAHLLSLKDTEKKIDMERLSMLAQNRIRALEMLK
ncbi:hypothetical protein G7Z17_g2224 [Cylindrodendrum hubeiense]|uniref:AAA+ ATPase domain-containing protein n=1 Tax=Cylindrodendrum hubeiense TaxID=595255 RepID=A0A9P5HD84_9HYPO|nr:hypothetical protein G7Z17_g2224 [Cylindrodendrum hubeiense]